MANTTISDRENRRSNPTSRRIGGAAALLGTLLVTAGLLQQALTDVTAGGDVVFDVQNTVFLVDQLALVAGILLLFVALVGFVLYHEEAGGIYWWLGVLGTGGGMAFSLASAGAQFAFEMAGMATLAQYAAYGFLAGNVGFIGASLPLGIALLLSGWAKAPELRLAGIAFAGTGPSISQGAIFFGLNGLFGGLLFVGAYATAWLLVAYNLLRADF
ncbi:MULTISPECIES: hypothetical protein [Haloprofundus]|uniref:hypothetical protein n=1 Tax=Haloprofundus TaxID=1911573 RepID=UPI0010BEB614|nr:MULTISPECIES: hypothetical protein [Haloprofundus]QCJ48131.1 hypothetical protein FCF25_13800 [Haloprofundus sp. MHR1]